VASCVLASFTLAACGSASAPTALASSCRAVTAVLSDGPDPQADPVGYAEAQVTPLAQLDISDHALATAVTALSRADESFFLEAGKGSTTDAVMNADTAVDAICPGATG
jgi:hypothetical protein